MADKPRVKAPKQRASTGPDTSGRTQRLLLIGAVLAALVVAGVLFAAVGRGGGGVDEESVRAAVQGAGCTLETDEPTSAAHSISEPSGTSKLWKTDPPTAGQQYGTPAIHGAYSDPLDQAPLVHNLEHGAVYIQYGDDVPDSTVEELRRFYDRHQNGTLLAPLPRLDDEIALGAWVVTDGELQDGDLGTGYLAKCKAFDEQAFSAFFDAFQFKGPERAHASSLAPGQ